MAPDNLIRVFTLNCWGLKYVSSDRIERVDAIASFLRIAPYDIVCLQELWIHKDFETIRAALTNRLPFHRLFHSGAVGAGLAIFSRFPIVTASLLPFSLNGHPLDFKGADWFAGKAIASVVVTHPILGRIEVFNTHLFSEGGDEGPEHARAHRLVNAWEFSKRVKQSADLGHHVIASGDFNSIPTTLPMTVVRDYAGLTDAWELLHPIPQVSQLDAGHIKPAEAIHLYGFTFDSPVNSYSTGRGADAFPPQGKRIDYVLYRNPPTTATLPPLGPRQQLVPIDSRVMLTDRISSQKCSYSDHFGVEATFSITNSEKEERTPSSEKSLTRGHAMEVVQALQTRLRLSAGWARNEMRVVYACFASFVALLIGTAWSPRGSLTPLFVFLGGLVTYVGTTMFHVGFLYRRWEANAMLNAIDEIELYSESCGHEETLRRSS